MSTKATDVKNKYLMDILLINNTTTQIALYKERYMQLCKEM